MWSSHMYTSTWKITFVSRCIGARGGADCRILLLNLRIFIFSILYVIITFVSIWKATFVSRCIGARGGVHCHILLLYMSILSVPYYMWSSHLYQGVLEQEEELIVTLRWLRRDHPSWHSVASGTPAVSDQSGWLYFYQLSCGICIELWKIFVIITAGPQSDSSLCALVSYSKLASAWLLTITSLKLAKMGWA